jgi:hypothetical protein
VNELEVRKPPTMPAATAARGHANRRIRTGEKSCAAKDKPARSGPVAEMVARADRPRDDHRMA